MIFKWEKTSPFWTYSFLSFLFSLVDSKFFSTWQICANRFWFYVHQYLFNISNDSLISDLIEENDYYNYDKILNVFGKHQDDESLIKIDPYAENKFNNLF